MITTPADERHSARETLVIATSNAGKLREFEALLPARLKLLSLADLSLDSPPETGRTFLENAVLKAEHASRISGYAAIADDSGLAVAALDGRPGVRSARFAGPDASDEDNNARLIAELERVSANNRAATFVCAVAFQSPNGLQLTAQAAVAGEITNEPRGNNGFGYDPHFVLTDPDAREFSGRTMAELTLNEKSRVSHRRRALAALIRAAQSLDHEKTSVALLLPDSQ